MKLFNLKNIITQFLIAILLIVILSFRHDHNPTLELNKDLHNFGVIEYNSNGNCEFIIKNTGNGTLIINNIKTSCGCVITNKNEFVIIPGDSMALNIKYDTKRPGAINKKIIIYSNDTYNPEKEIFLKGYVKPRIQ